MNEVQIVFYIRSRTFEVEVFYKNIFGVFIGFEFRRDLRNIFKNTLSR